MIHYAGIKDDFVYVLIPKCASSAIKKTLDIKNEELTLEEIVNLKQFKFTFVRNPWKRIISCWNHWIVGIHSNWIFKDNPTIKEKMSFNNFVSAISKIPDESANDHFASQTAFITWEDEIFVDFIGKLETMNESWQILKDKFNFPEIKKANKSKHRNKKEYLKTENLNLYYNQNTWDIIKKRYEKDIEMLGYKECKLI